MISVKKEDLDAAFEWAEGGEYGTAAYINRQTGQFYWQGEDYDLPDELHLPADIEDEEKYIELPTKRDLDLGSQLVFDFTLNHMLDDYDRVREIFRRRGAYSQFKDLLHRKDLIDQWYQYEREKTDEKRSAWCEEHGLVVDE